MKNASSVVFFVLTTMLWFVWTDFSDLNVEGGEEDDQGRPALFQVLLKRQGQCNSFTGQFGSLTLVHTSFLFSLFFFLLKNPGNFTFAILLV